MNPKKKAPPEPSQHVVTRWVCGSADEYLIDQARFNRTCIAKDGVLLCVDLEEKLAILLDNYYEFEMELFSHGLRWVMHEDWRWSTRRDLVLTINRRLLNLTNAIWMYWDQVRGELKRCKNSLESEFRKHLVKQIDSAFSSPSLLLTKILRNYCQHQDVGLEGVGVSRARYKLSRSIPKLGPEDRNFATATLAVRVADLSISRNHPARPQLDKLHRTKVEKWDPAPALRSAIDEITKLHCELRSELSEKLDEWNADLQWVFNIAEREFPDQVALCVAEKLGRGRYRKRVEVFQDLMQRVENLRKTNGDSTNLATTIVTAIEPQKKS